MTLRLAPPLCLARVSEIGLSASVELSLAEGTWQIVLCTKRVKAALSDGYCGVPKLMTGLIVII